MVEEKKTKAKKAEAGAPTPPVPPAPPIDPPTPPEKPKSGKKVEIDEKLLQDLVARDEKREEILKQQTKDIERLTHAADKSRLAQFDAQHQGALIRTAFISSWIAKKDSKERLILGWEMARDEVGFTDGKLIAHQTVRLFLDEGEGEDPLKEEVEYLYWSRNVKKIKADIIKESITPDGVFRTLKLPDGREVELDIRFLN